MAFAAVDAGGTLAHFFGGGPFQAGSILVAQSQGDLRRCCTSHGHNKSLRDPLKPRLSDHQKATGT